METVEELVEEGTFSHKSEFYRFAVELLLDQLNEEYEPEMLNYDVLSEATQQSYEDASDQSDGSMFYQSAIVVRRHARREEINTAEEYINTHYPPERGNTCFLRRC